MKLSVKNIYKLDEDYNNLFINNTAHFLPDYTIVQLSNRVINKTQHNDIYILEPNSYYYVEFNEDIQNDLKSDDFSHLMQFGLVVQFDKNKGFLYLHNVNQNMIYIQKGSVLYKR